MSKWLPRDFNRREIMRVHRSLFPLAFVLVVTLGLPVLLRGNFMKRFGAMGFVFIMSALTVMYGWFRPAPKSEARKVHRSAFRSIDGALRHPQDGRGEPWHGA